MWAAMQHAGLGAVSLDMGRVSKSPARGRWPCCSPVGIAAARRPVVSAAVNATENRHVVLLAEGAA